MANNLGRDKLWSPEIWAEIDKAVMAEVGRLRVAQKVFPARQTPNAPNVPADELALDEGGQVQYPLMIQEGTTQPFMEISFEFMLTQGQVDNEATLRAAQTLARLSARSVATAEDRIFFQGTQAELPPGVRITNAASAEDGLLGLQGAQDTIVVPPSGDNGYGGETFAAVSQGIGQLIDAGHPGPYALILEASVFADAHTPIGNRMASPADRIGPLVEGRFYGTGTLPPDTGLLVSLGGDPTTIYIAQDAITAYTQEDQRGNHRFRIFERVQIVAREPQAFVGLHFQAQA